MAVTKQIVQIVTCDMCKIDITSWPQYHISIAVYDLDLCEHCKDKLKPSLIFLTDKTKIDIRYKWKEDD